MGVLGHFLYRPDFGVKGQAEYLAFDGGLYSADAEIYAAQIHRLATTNVHGLVFTSPGAGGGLDADKLDGKHASEFLISETDPVFLASPAAGITIGNIANWNAAFSWGNHAGLYSLLGHNHSGVYEAIGAVATHAALAASVHGVSASGFEDKANKGTVSGYASLDASTKVAQDPANATATPTQNKIPIADGVGGTLALGWIPAIPGSEDLTAKYKITDIDDSGSTKYFGFIDKDGNWFIMSLTATEARYVKGTSGYTTNWTGCAGLTYDYFYNAF